MQNRAMREYAARRGWMIAMQVKEVGSGASQRQMREKLMLAVRRREIDVVLVWRLDRWGRSVTDLLATLQELDHLGVGFVSLTEALDLTTPAGRAMAALLAVFAEFEREILRERVRAGLAHARQNGKRLGQPATATMHTDEVRKLRRSGLSKSEIARRLNIGRTSVRRILAAPPRKEQPAIFDYAALPKTHAVRRLVSWYREGKNVQRLLPHLATYLGHVSIQETARYLSMTKELLDEAGRRFEHYAAPGGER